MNNILTGRKYFVKGSWYEPIHKIKSFDSVEHALLWDTTSSAGDWYGYFVQKIGSQRYLIQFSQENNSDGFTLWTSNKPIATWCGFDMQSDELTDLIVQYEELEG